MKTRQNLASLSPKAAGQLAQLRQTMTFKELATLIPCSSATIWKASGGGTLARPTRFYFEHRLNELSAGNTAERGKAAA